MNGLESPQIEHYMTNNLQTSGHFCTCAFRVNWADDKQTSWIIALWWLSVSLWRICITFFDQVECFASIKLCQALTRQGAIIKIPVVRFPYLWCLGAQYVVFAFFVLFALNYNTYLLFNKNKIGWNHSSETKQRMKDKRYPLEELSSTKYQR